MDAQGAHLGLSTATDFDRADTTITPPSWAGRYLEVFLYCMYTVTRAMRALRTTGYCLAPRQ